MAIDAESQYGVLLVLAHGVDEILSAAAVWSGQSLDAVLRDFPVHMVKRLEEIEVSPAGVQAWADLFQ